MRKKEVGEKNIRGKYLKWLKIYQPEHFLNISKQTHYLVVSLHHSGTGVLKSEDLEKFTSAEDLDLRMCKCKYWEG